MRDNFKNKTLVKSWVPIAYKFVHEHKSKSNLRCRKYDWDMYHVNMAGWNVLVVFPFLYPTEVEKAEKGKGLIIHLREISYFWMTYFLLILF